MYDITKKRATETASIDLVTGEGAPLLDDNNKQLSVTVHGPGSKVWKQADAERSRRRTARIEKNRGRISAALEHAGEDDIDFLVAITVSFNGWDYPNPAKGENDEPLPWPSQRDMFRAAYADDGIGYIRDHVRTEATDWSAFTKGSAKN
jgi:hypothetical protein